jgi:hypothetical protein
MSVVDTYSKKYPDAWEVSGNDPEGFLVSLAEAGVIEERMIVPLLSQHRLAQQLRTPEPEHDLEYYKNRYPFHWLELEENPMMFVRELYKVGLMGYDDYARIYKELPTPVITDAERAAIIGVPLFDPAVEAQIEQIAKARDVPVEQIREEFTRRGSIGDALFDKVKEWFRVAYREVLVSLWRFMIDKLKELIDLVVGYLKPILQDAWEMAKAKLSEEGRKVFDGLMRIYEGHSNITPEDAPALAGKMYLFAMAAGTAAHGVSTAFELLHPLKRLGLHQTAAMIGDFAGFSRISGATIGPLVSRVLGTAMTYAVQNRYRPRIPDERLLIEFRSKREIDKAEFDKAMGYQGYSKAWTDVIERWQWKDPRMFEIIRLADVGLEQGPPPSSEMPWLRRFGVTGKRLKDWWLYRKFMRAGYEDVDLDVMVNFIHRREVAFALTYVRTAIRRNYRWGYLSDEELDSWMGRLNLPEQAKQWIRWAGDLDREYFYRQDLVGYYKAAFRNDVIDDDELLVSLLSMGLPPREASITVRTEKVKRQPKVRAAREKASEKAASDIQKKYVTLYLEQFRKGLIHEGRLLEALLAIGIRDELAEVTVQLESAKKAPVPPPQ